MPDTSYHLFEKTPIPGCDPQNCPLNGPCSECTQMNPCKDCSIHLGRHLNALLGLVTNIFPEDEPEEQIERAQTREVSARHAEDEWRNQLAPKTDNFPCPDGEHCFVDPVTGEVL